MRANGKEGLDAVVQGTRGGNPTSGDSQASRNLDGKEGVDGSSPSEGLRKARDEPLHISP
jgi:hypothetical protein